MNKTDKRVSKEQYLNMKRKQQDAHEARVSRIAKKISKRCERLADNVEKLFIKAFNKGENELYINQNYILSPLVGLYFKKNDVGRVRKILEQRHPDLIFTSDKEYMSETVKYGWAFKEVKALPSGS